MSYHRALEEQAERNRTKKLQLKNKGSLKSVRLPNTKDIAPLQKQYQSAPNLMKLFMLVQHTFQTVRQMNEKSLEFDRVELEYLYLFIQQLEEVANYYRTLLTRLYEAQENKLNALAELPTDEKK
ncbi:MAG: hypothetical protein QME64_01935 [bacterium]|nr:hypothetical protein [bacterium]